MSSTIEVEREVTFDSASSSWSNFLFATRPPILNSKSITSGYCYDYKNGEYLGKIGKPVNEILIGRAEYSYWKRDINKTVTRVKDLSKLSISHSDFTERAATIYGESTAYISNDFLELAKEMAAIAFVHLTNKKAYGNKSAPANLFRRTQIHKRTGKMQLANWAVINSVVPGGFDYSYGADMWDGQEQAQFPPSELRGSTGKFEIHMNTMGWSISNAHYAKWKKNVGSSFKAPQVRVSPKNYPGKYPNKGKIRLYSKAVYGKTIFWEER